MTRPKYCYPVAISISDGNQFYPMYAEIIFKISSDYAKVIYLTVFQIRSIISES